MTKEPWTPDNCPVQAGMVIHDVMTNTDILVAKRYLDYADDDTDKDKPLLELANGDRFTGRELFDGPYTYYPKWPSTADEQACYREVEDKPLYPVLVGLIHDALVKTHYAKEGVHYYNDNGVRIWEDDLCTEINNATDNLAKVFEEFKHDEQQ